MAVATTPVSTAVARSVAPGIRAPESSVTVPVTAAKPAPCPKADTDSDSDSNRMAVVSKAFFIEFSPNRGLSDCEFLFRYPLESQFSQTLQSQNQGIFFYCWGNLIYTLVRPGIEVTAH